MKKSLYTILSIYFAVLIIWTALPYYLLTPIIIKKENIYLPYGFVQALMLMLFPGLALLGVLTTLKKKNTFEDVLLNCSQGMLVMLALKAAQYFLWLCVGSFVLAAVLCIFRCRKACEAARNAKLRRSKKRRLCYYTVRRVGAFTLLLTLTPLAVWSNCRESSEKKEEYLTVYSRDEIRGRPGMWELVSAEEWEKMDTEERFTEISDVVWWTLDGLGVETTKVRCVKEMQDSVLAYYTDSKNTISFNAVRLAHCDQETAISVAAHECYHAYEHKIIRSLDILERQGVECKNMEFFAYAYELRDASETYELDSQTYEGYAGNLLEVEANAYADRLIEWLKSKELLEE